MPSYLRDRLEDECSAATGRSFGEWLNEAYWGWGTGRMLLSEMLGTCVQTLSSFFSYYGIALRSQGEAVRIGKANVLKPTKAALRNDYFVSELSYRDMAEKYGVSYQTISNWLHEDGIKPRDASAAGTVQNRKRKSAIKIC